MFDANTDIVVVTNKVRKSLITPHLINVPYKMSFTPDYELPKGFDPKVKGLTHNHLGTYRCFKGHQLAIATSEKERVLIFEDDAVPKNPNWINVINKAIPLLDDFEMVSFHGRGYHTKDFKSTLKNYAYMQPIIKKTWIVAALAYLISRKSYEKIVSKQYEGVPFDLLLY